MDGPDGGENPARGFCRASSLDASCAHFPGKGT